IRSRTIQNKLASTQLSHMPRRKLVFIGPMSDQPGEHGSITLNQSPSEKPTIDRLPEAGRTKQSARAEALRIAKAKITRRNSLQKQRKLQKLDVRIDAVMRGKADIGKPLIAYAEPTMSRAIPPRPSRLRR